MLDIVRGAAFTDFDTRSCCTRTDCAEEELGASMLRLYAIELVAVANARRGLSQRIDY